MDVRDLEELLGIGEALLTEKEIDRLLEMILSKTRKLLSADAGSIFLAEGPSPDQPTQLRFKLAQNDSVQAKFQEFVLPISPKNLAGYVAATRNTIRFDDVYLIPEGLPFGFSREVDLKTGYRSKSVLSVSMTDHRNQLIGVLQLWNKKKNWTVQLTPESVATEVLSFTEGDQRLLLSLAGQMGIAIENTRLYEEISSLFESFILASVNAIESRDPTTSGHSERVAKLTIGLARSVDQTSAEPYRGTRFSSQEMKELEYAALLHDFGKIGVRESVLVKAKKLYPMELEVIQARFDALYRSVGQEGLLAKLDHLNRGGKAGDESWQRLEVENQKKLLELQQALALVVDSNEPNVLPEAVSSHLSKLDKYELTRLTGEKIKVIEPDQVRRLMIPKGSLSESERLEIESHVTHTYRYLEKIPWTRDLGRIPAIAYAHHEKLNGTGYPRKIEKKEIPLQSQIMAVADIFDALTASDRPYKKAVPPEKALDILKMEVRQNQLEGALVDLFIESKVYHLVT